MLCCKLARDANDEQIDWLFYYFMTARTFPQIVPLIVK